MTTLNISLPDSIGKFIEEKVAKQDYSNASEYICHLISQEQEKEAQKRLETLLLEGLDSGTPVEVTDEWWETKRAQLLERLRVSAS